MRGEVDIPMSKTQKLRLESALEKLESKSTFSDASVTVADEISVNNEDGILKGHGTTEIDGRVMATLCGVVERVNKLVLVRALRARYKPESGDIIVGRVIEVAPKRWKLDINYRLEAVLMLSSMNLPDGIQRRRNAADELNMRSIFEENDVVCAEVGSIQNDGSVLLLARSQKYGKLNKGQVLTIPPYLVKRRKQHFHHLEHYGVDLILGMNGFVWVGEHVVASDDMMAVDVIKKPEENEQEETHTPLEIRQSICRIANVVRVLSALGFTITVEAITELVDLSTSMGLDINDMLGAEFYVIVAEKEAERRSSSSKKLSSKKR